MPAAVVAAYSTFVVANLLSCLLLLYYDYERITELLINLADWDWTESTAASKRSPLACHWQMWTTWCTHKRYYAHAFTFISFFPFAAPQSVCKVAIRLVLNKNKLNCLQRRQQTMKKRLKGSSNMCASDEMMMLLRNECTLSSAQCPAVHGGCLLALAK